MSTITGTIDATDIHQASLVGNDLRVGSISVLDKAHDSYISGVIIEDTIRQSRDSTFLQGSLLTPSDLPLTLMDSTYTGGFWNGDGTLIDSTYRVRTFDPYWINYSIWFLIPPDATSAELQGYRLRTAANNDVGEYYANMYAPDPGHYEIRWRYQKDQSSLGHEIIEPFSVSTEGIDPQPDYT